MIVVALAASEGHSTIAKGARASARFNGDAPGNFRLSFGNHELKRRERRAPGLT
jgi:hypothetical protein